MKALIRNCTITLFIVLLAAVAISCGTKKKLINSIINESLSFSEAQYIKMSEIMENLPEKLPRTFEKNEKLVTSNDKWWTSGFFPGTLWYLYESSESDLLKKYAELFSERVENQQFTINNHDVGFIINCSFGNGYRLTHDDSYRQVIINAAKSLSTRYNRTTKTIRSWDNTKWEYPVIIDNMMNLELLCVATNLTGDSSYHKIAVAHANTTLANHYRPDGSSYHIVNYDTISGKVIERITHQGAFDESAWSRGQAWGLYGFTVMYRETGDTAYLNKAVKIASFIMNHPNLPDDKIPYWDFNAPKIPNALRDASAGAIMASACIELSSFLEGSLSEKIRDLAETQIKSLSSPKYRAKLGENGNFILKHSVGFLAKESEVDVPLTYADYYYVEALIRLRNQINQTSLAKK